MPPDTDEIAPIACTLDTGGLKERLDWIADLNRRALRESHRDDLRLTSVMILPQSLTSVEWWPVSKPVVPFLISTSWSGPMLSR